MAENKLLLREACTFDGFPQLLVQYHQFGVFGFGAALERPGLLFETFIVGRVVGMNAFIDSLGDRLLALFHRLQPLPESLLLFLGGSKILNRRDINILKLFQHGFLLSRASPDTPTVDPTLTQPGAVGSYLPLDVEGPRDKGQGTGDRSQASGLRSQASGSRSH